MRVPGAGCRVPGAVPACRGRASVPIGARGAGRPSRWSSSEGAVPDSTGPHRVQPDPHRVGRTAVRQNAVRQAVSERPSSGSSRAGISRLVRGLRRVPGAGVAAPGEQGTPADGATRRPPAAAGTARCRREAPAVSGRRRPCRPGDRPAAARRPSRRWPGRRRARRGAPRRAVLRRPAAHPAAAAGAHRHGRRPAAHRRCRRHGVRHRRCRRPGARHRPCRRRPNRPCRARRPTAASARSASAECRRRAP